ncbi:hypothetical protein BT96DRAFT_915896 [Gymnopus androsaceus JB14]|uniref:Yeast cell wall synthesis Kre9/Knh1-like N-terminal domain-containing protein n=1 Tax=Gymnopus androsaceus JB14 TaxID=1447944 RepID=A0A6A4I9E2_9AGAR|nr:hypothetical protein BT96DRAFT_915896 [Gymnopus androsaceus JB14]
MPSLFITLCFLIISIASLASSAPIAARDVFVPTITSPHANTVWQCGQRATVTWAKSNIPASEVTNPKGMVLLRDLNGLEDVEHPLASNFNTVNSTSVSFVVPNVPSGEGYEIVLFGDSGNFSPKFTIKC